MIRKMMRVGMAAVAAVMLIAGSATAQQVNQDAMKGMKWRSIGPFRGGRVIAVAGVSSQPNVFYFGGVGGGIWKTTDAGNTWTPMSDKLAVSSMGSIAVAESDANIVYAGSGEACIRGNISHGDGVYKSTDAGKTWTHKGLPDSHHIARIVIHPTNPDIVYAGSVSFMRSTDGGASWEKREPGHGDLTVIDFVPWNYRYVDLCGDGGFIIHDDSTNTVSDSTEYFSPGAFIQVYGFDYAWSDPSLMLAGLQDNGVVLSTTGLGAQSSWLQVEGCDGGQVALLCHRAFSLIDLVLRCCSLCRRTKATKRVAQ